MDKSFKMIYRELAFTGLWELVACCGGCCPAGFSNRDWREAVEVAVAGRLGDGSKFERNSAGHSQSQQERHLLHNTKKQIAHLIVAVINSCRRNNKIKSYNAPKTGSRLSRNKEA